MESRLAALTVDTEEMSKLSEIIGTRSDLPSSFQPQQIIQTATSLTPLFNALHARRAIIPAANGHMSARALARYYAALADGSKIPPPHSSTSEPPLGSHPHKPKFSPKTSKKDRGCRLKRLPIPLINRTNNSEDLETKRDGNANRNGFTRIPTTDSSSSYSSSNGERDSRTHSSTKMFDNPRILDQFLGTGEYKNLVLPGGSFGLGFKRFGSEDSSTLMFGHSGMGGSTGFCDVTNNFAIAVTLNKVAIGAVTAKIVHLVCSELNIPVPAEFMRFAAASRGPASESNYVAPIIN